MRRSITDLFRIYISIFFLVFVIITPASAQNVCNWTGAGSGSSWHTAENWECDAHDGVPTVDDSVLIAPAGTVEVLLGDHAEARALVVGIDDDEIDSETHNLKTTADNIELMIGEGGLIIHQSGRFDLGQWRTPCCVGARPPLRATLHSDATVVVYGGLYISNTTIFSDILLTRPDAGGRGRLQARGWNVIHGKLDVIDGFLQPVVPGGFHGNPQPHLRVVDNDILISDSSSVQIYVDSYPLGPPPPDEAPAITVEGGLLDQRGRFTTSGNPGNNRVSPIIIDARVANSGFITSRLARAQGFSFRGPVDAVHENSGTIEIGGLLGSDTEEDAVDGFGLLIDEDRSLSNTGEIYLHRLRTAEGQISNTDGGVITDEISVTEPGDYILGFEGPQSIQIELLDTRNIERLAMTWHGEDHPDAGLNQNIEGTRNWWDLSATDIDSLPASGNMSLSFPRLNPNTPQVCRYIDDPAGWDCLTTLVSTNRAEVAGLSELSEWAVADTLIDSGSGQVDVLDTDFGEGGIITHQIQDYDVAHDVILQPDGSIITFGQSSEIGNLPHTRVATMVTFDEDTTQTESYTYNTTAFGCGTVPQSFHAGVKLENGQFIGGGYRQDGCSGTPRYFRLIRLDEDGSADHIFNDAVFNSAIAYVYDLAVQPDGKVVAAGRASTAGFNTPEYGSTFDAAFARYQTDGSLDTGFGTDGEVTVDVNGDYDFLRATVLQDDGKVIGGGFTTTENGRDFLLIRLDTGGSIDTGFGTDGIVIHDFHGFDDQIFDVAIQDDDKIVVAGRSTGADEVTVRYTIARFNSDGSPDTEFADNGIALVDFGGTDGFASVAQAKAVKIDPAGRIFTAGTVETGNGEESKEVAVAVLHPEGSLNTGFNSNGTAVFGYGAGPIDVANDLDIDPLTGRIAVAGYSGERIDGDLNTKAAVARLIGFKDISLPGQITLMSPVDNSEDIPRLTSLEWESENDADQYRVQISTESNFSSLLVDSVYSQTSLTLTDPLVSATLHYWRVSGINGDGEGDWSDTWSFTTELATSAETPGNLPTVFSLHQNYPNPFNPSTVIRYDVPDPSNVLIEVYNMIGQRVSILVNEHKAAGRYTVDFNAGRLSSGMYLYRMSVQNSTPGTSDFTAVRKLMLIK